ncbi:DUF6310 domain-containing protein [Corallococcus terminator]|uniref:DUF6310 domain-containing protein n=1 Tax=Corallococcus terminator TaxID=2316733 RepID=A0A3A8JLD1_9BACT|nr:DUF6310 domain-containing protein [Corallococcus terminator]RKG93094.1 hypothetical protein D7V88_03920 [Corallococcus terminator]
MHFRPFLVLLLLSVACATTESRSRPPAVRTVRLGNLQRAAALPWTDDGRCVVQEASQPWPGVVERCFHALDTRRIRFRDTARRCSVASADAATLEMMVGVCLLTQPELVVGAVVVIGLVVVAVAIHEEIEAYELRHSFPEEGSLEDAEPEAMPVAQESGTQRKPVPDPSPAGQDLFPPGPPRDSDPRERRPECAPQPVPHLGGDALHNMCADRVPLNGFPGFDVLVNGKRFDALQSRVRVLWEIKTDNFETYPSDLREIVLRKQARELRRERELAEACGFDFRIGVRSAAHEKALRDQDPTFKIVVIDWC